MSHHTFSDGLFRRGVMIGLGASAAASTLPSGRAVGQTPPDVPPPSGTHMQILSRLVGGRPATPGRVKILVAEVIDNAASVPVTVTIDSPMTADDRCVAIHVVSDGNPRPEIMSVRFGRIAGRAEVSTRLRLARSQSIVVYAEMSDGSVWSGLAATTVTIGGCGV